MQYSIIEQVYGDTSESHSVHFRSKRGATADYVSKVKSEKRITPGHVSTARSAPEITIGVGGGGEGDMMEMGMATRYIMTKLPDACNV